MNEALLPKVESHVGDYTYTALAVPVSTSAAVAVVCRQDRWAHDLCGREPVPLAEFNTATVAEMLRRLERQSPIRHPESDDEHRQYYDKYV